jgi:hypothetical protein
LTVVLLDVPRWSPDLCRFKVDHDLAISSIALQYPMCAAMQRKGSCF